MKTYTDDFGFYAGEVADEFAADFPRTTYDLPAPGAPPMFQGWRPTANGQGWELAPDNRGRLWYDPTGVLQDFRAETPDAQPPVGFLEHVNGQSRTVQLPLATLQDAKWAQTKTAREAFISAPLPTPHGVFDCDPDSRKSITDAVLMLQTLAAIGSPSTIDFTLADNSVATLTTAQMVEVGLLMGQRVQQAYAIGRMRRTAIYAATNAAEVEAVPVW
jgi:hypothetical protein